MSSARKMKRQMLKEWAREGKKPAEEIAKAAAVEIRDIKKEMVMFLVENLGAVSLMLMNDYGKLKKRQTRMTVFFDTMEKYRRNIRQGKLTSEEFTNYQEFAVMFYERWEAKGEEKNEGNATGGQK